MALERPQRTSGWVLNSQNGIESLMFVRDLALPSLKDDEVLVKIHAASLNYRELVLVKVMTPIFCRSASSGSWLKSHSRAVQD